MIPNGKLDRTKQGGNIARCVGRNKLSYKGHTADAWALRADEGRDKLRKVMGSRK